MVACRYPVVFKYFSSASISNFDKLVDTDMVGNINLLILSEANYLKLMLSTTSVSTSLEFFYIRKYFFSVGLTHAVFEKLLPTYTGPSCICQF